MQIIVTNQAGNEQSRCTLAEFFASNPGAFRGASSAKRLIRSKLERGETHTLNFGTHGVFTLGQDMSPLASVIAAMEEDIGTVPDNEHRENLLKTRESLSAFVNSALATLRLPAVKRALENYDGNRMADVDARDAGLVAREALKLAGVTHE